MKRGVHLYELHKPVYIPSLEGSDIYNHNLRKRNIKLNYLGMLPSSLELNKLVQIGLKITTKKESEKYISNDIINVKFKQKVKSGLEVIDGLESKKERNENIHPEYYEKLSDYIDVISGEIDEAKWEGMGIDALRDTLYQNGFQLNGVDYVVYKRSSAKSRIGQCLFIKKNLHKKMIKWSRLGLNFTSKKAKNIDYPSLLAYESLVGSSLEDVVKINPENILIVSDVDSIFKTETNVIRTGKNGLLDSFEEVSTIKNSLFDGESLLDSSYFKNGKSMFLLRNHMFKSAAFNCNIQTFLKDHCPEGINYSEWCIETMFDDVYIYAKDIHLITTPNSLKALKFSSLLGGEKEMWDHWKAIVEEDGCMFGVCKSEKETKRNISDEDKPLQQTSYQMLNSLPLNQKEMENLLLLERDFISKLKNDDDYFIDYVMQNANSVNSNHMFVDLYQTNSRIVDTHTFRKFRKKLISSHVTHIKNGKVRLRGDYCVMLGNPIEFLLHSIGKLNTHNPESHSLHGNEIYTNLFSEKELTGFRNPHTSPSNVLIAKNKTCKDIDKYFNLSKNIVCVNAIKFPIQDILSGSDYDSDTILLFDDNTLLSVAKIVYGKYKVCVNQVESSKKIYAINNKDMAVIDNELSKSQRFIGRTVNVGQLCMSRYWHIKNTTKDTEDLQSLLKKVNVITVLSGICIDLAKKMFDIDINKEIKYISESKELIEKKPLFWKYVSQNGKIQTCMYECPMDHLFLAMEKGESANHRKAKAISINEVITETDKKTVNRKQAKKIIEYVETMCSKIKSAYISNLNTDEETRKIDDIIKYYKFYVSKLSISVETMNYLVSYISSETGIEIGIRLLNILHSTNKDTFLVVFDEKRPNF